MMVSVMRNYRVVLWALALLGLAADQGAKYGVFASLTSADKHRHWLFQTGPETGFALETRYDEEQELKGVFVPHVNQGALFGLGPEALPLDDQQGQNGGADQQGDHVGGVHDMEDE